MALQAKIWLKIGAVGENLAENRRRKQKFGSDVMFRTFEKEHQKNREQVILNKENKEQNREHMIFQKNVLFRTKRTFFLEHVLSIEVSADW